MNQSIGPANQAKRSRYLKRASIKHWKSGNSLSTMQIIQPTKMLLRWRSFQLTRIDIQQQSITTHRGRDGLPTRIPTPPHDILRVSQAGRNTLAIPHSQTRRPENHLPRPVNHLQLLAHDTQRQPRRSTPRKRQRLRIETRDSLRVPHHPIGAKTPRTRNRHKVNPRKHRLIHRRVPTDHRHRKWPGPTQLKELLALLHPHQRLRPTIRHRRRRHSPPSTQPTRPGHQRPIHRRPP